MITKPFDNYRRNTFSQNGEDGVLYEIINNRLKIDRVNFIEVGAWDGEYLSNTRQFHGKGRGLLVEKDQQRHAVLVNKVKGIVPLISAACAEVTEEGLGSIDSLLKFYHMPDDITLLSIDTDGFDYRIWRGFTSVRPCVVIVEIDSSTPPGIYSNTDGSVAEMSFSAMLDLGNSKGYSLVCHTGNMIFVRSDLVPLLGSIEPALSHPELLFDRSWLR